MFVLMLKEYFKISKYFKILLFLGEEGGKEKLIKIYRKVLILWNKDYRLF